MSASGRITVEGSVSYKGSPRAERPFTTSYIHKIYALPVAMQQPSITITSNGYPVEPSFGAEVTPGHVVEVLVGVDVPVGTFDGEIAVDVERPLEVQSALFLTAGAAVTCATAVSNSPLQYSPAGVSFSWRLDTCVRGYGSSALQGRHHFRIELRVPEMSIIAAGQTAPRVHITSRSANVWYVEATVLSPL